MYKYWFYFSILILGCTTDNSKHNQASFKSTENAITESKNEANTSHSTANFDDYLRNINNDSLKFEQLWEKLEDDEMLAFLNYFHRIPYEYNLPSNQKRMDIYRQLFNYYFQEEKIDLLNKFFLGEKCWRNELRLMIFKGSPEVCDKKSGYKAREICLFLDNPHTCTKFRVHEE